MFLPCSLFSHATRHCFMVGHLHSRSLVLSLTSREGFWSKQPRPGSSCDPEPSVNGFGTGSLGFHLILWLGMTSSGSWHTDFPVRSHMCVCVLKELLRCSAIWGAGRWCGLFLLGTQHVEMLHSILWVSVRAHQRSKFQESSQFAQIAPWVGSGDGIHARAFHAVQDGGLGSETEVALHNLLSFGAVVILCVRT